MLTLPFPPHRSHLLGFWISLHGLGCLMVAFIALLAPEGGNIALVLFLLLVGSFAVGLMGREFRLFGYRGWNRLAHILGHFLERWVVLIVHVLILGSIRLAGTRLPLCREGGSTWEPYPPGSASERSDVQGAPNRSALAVRLLRAARHDERRWWIALVPFVTLLAWLAVRPNQEFEVPTQQYTLY